MSGHAGFLVYGLALATLNIGYAAYMLRHPRVATAGQGAAAGTGLERKAWRLVFLNLLLIGAFALIGSPR